MCWWDVKPYSINQPSLILVWKPTRIHIHVQLPVIKYRVILAMLRLDYSTFGRLYVSVIQHRLFIFSVSDHFAADIIVKDLYIMLSSVLLFFCTLLKTICGTYEHHITSL